MASNETTGDSSERDLIIEIAALAAAARHGGLARCRPGRAEIARLVAAEIAAAAVAAAAACTVEHGQRRIEALQHDFGGVFFDPRLVGPLARLQLAFEVN